MNPATRKLVFPSLLVLFIFSLNAPVESLAATSVSPPQSIVAEVEGEKITAEQLEKTIAVELTDLQD